jgi:hypothetical protein
MLGPRVVLAQGSKAMSKARGQRHAPACPGVPQRRARSARSGPDGACDGASVILFSYPPGIGFFFYTRKGSFLYKISLYIITYHVAIIVYHCVSLSISQYIMSLGDTWYQWYRWYIMHDMIYHDIWCSFWTHDTNMISQKIKLWYTAKKYHVPYHAASVSCFGINDIWTWYRSGMTWDMRWQTIFTFTFISMISLHIYQYHVISCDIMWYHVITCDIQYHVISAVSCGIMWYHVISCDTCIKRVSLADLSVRVSVRGSLIP